jgi:hypothetical protein
MPEFRQCMSVAKAVVALERKELVKSVPPRGHPRRRTREVSSGEGFLCEERRSRADWRACWSAGLRRFIGEWPVVDIRIKVFSKLSWMP